MTHLRNHRLKLVTVAALVAVGVPAIAMAQSSFTDDAGATGPALLSLPVHSTWQFLDLRQSLRQTYREQRLERGVQVRASEAMDAPPNASGNILLRAPEPPPPPPPAPAPVASSTGSGIADWYAIAMCESSGDWSANTGNGYWGGLQFAPSTWFGYGGGPFDGVGPFPYSDTEQIAVAERVLAGQGPGAWPNCFVYA